MRNKKLLLFAVLIGLVVSLSSAGIAWGPNGHRVVGAVAENNLNPTARNAVRDLLQGESLAAVSNWADLIRSFQQWRCAEPFHYTNIPPGMRYTDSGVPAEGDVLGAIGFYFKVLRDPSRSRLERSNAIRFLTHFIGDMHQPLHVGFGCDRGGNDVVVRWMGEEARLHSVWDSRILESLELSYSEYVNLLAEPSTQDRQRIQSSGPLTWARESQELLQEVYRCSTGQDGCPCLCGDCADGYSVFGGCAERPCQLVPAPITLSYEYGSRAQPIISRRLQEGGLRLAAVLNWALSDTLPSAEFTEFLRTLDSKPGWDAPFQACTGR